MTELSDDDHSRSPVPENETIGLFRMILVVLAISIALPAFVMGPKIAQGLGLRDAVIACYAGGAVLALIGALAGVAGATARVSSYTLIIAAFGRVGGRLINFALGLCALGWFGVIAALFGSTVRQIMGHTLAGVGAPGWVLIGAILFITTTIFGFKALDRMSIIVTPLKVGLLVWTLLTAWLSYKGASPWTGPTHGWPTMSTWISFVVGGFAGGAALSPDITRYSRSPGQAAWAPGIAYGIGFPTVLILAGIPTILTGEQNYITLMVALGLGIPALIVVVFAAWTTNVYNLYVGSLTLVTIFTRPKQWVLTVIAGVIGTTMGLAGISDRIGPFLSVLSIGVPPIAGVYLAHFYFERYAERALALPPRAERSVHPDAIAAWAIGFGFAAFSERLGIWLTTNGALDSLVMSAVLYLASRFALLCYRQCVRPGLALTQPNKPVVDSICEYGTYPY
jgi:cytosine permease